MVVLPLIYFLYYHNVVASSSAEESPSITSRGHLEVPDTGKSDAAADFDWRIWGGKLVSITLVPYAVLYGTCGGSIIAPNWVITAAHCDKNHVVYAGSHESTKTFVYAIKRHVYHPGWLKPKIHPYDYDLLLLELVASMPVVVFMKPIALGGIEDLNPGQLVSISGWGHTEYMFNITRELSQMTEKLRQVWMTLVDYHDCETTVLPRYTAKFGEPSDLTTRMACAEGDKGGICYGDSGSGVVANGKLVGVVSWSPHCEPINIFTNVVQMKDWIRATTGLPL